MLTYFLRRVLLTIPVLIGIATLVFLLVHLVPGDPAVSMLGEGATGEDIAALRTRLGLDEPMLVQYGTFLRGAVRGDLGRSFRSNQPVTTEIFTRIPRTLQLAIAAMAVASLIAIPLGVVAAVFKGRWPDQTAMTFAVIGLSLPAFWVGPMLAWGFAVGLGWLPVSGYGTWAHLVLPSITLGLALAALLARMTRTTTLEELRELYVMAARARGASRWRATLVHAFRNSLIPVVTIIGLQFGAVLTGSIVTETIFAWPGIGRLLITAINTRDYPLIQGCILWIATIYVGVNLLTDLLYGVLDPRIRYE
jgi:ABC-type dipeptide/oligopeptide/nickel transport system permease component